jgi:hypothetical protein
MAAGKLERPGQKPALAVDWHRIMQHHAGQLYCGMTSAERRQHLRLGWHAEGCNAL